MMMVLVALQGMGQQNPSNFAPGHNGGYSLTPTFEAQYGTKLKY